ncbi:hypothetical protein HFD88_001567 [Aspergillus terreus]|nr:hypothetical protein HFD88_001567 [Aspergillus terreus]
MVRKFRDDEHCVRSKAVVAVGSLQPLPQHILDHLCQYLGEEHAPRSAILGTLYSQPLQLRHLDSLVMYFNHEHLGLQSRSSIPVVLSCQESLPNNIFRFLEENVDPTRTNSIFCQEMLEGLSDQSDLPTDILVRVARFLGDRYQVEYAASVLRHQKKDTLSTQLLSPIAEAITKYIMAGDEVSTKIVIAALSDQRYLAEPIFHLICSKFSDIEWGPVFDALVMALHTTDTFYPKLLRLPIDRQPYFDSLVRHGLVHRWALYFRRGRLVLDVPAQRKQIPMRSQEIVRFWLVRKLHQLDLVQ